MKGASMSKGNAILLKIAILLLSPFATGWVTITTAGSFDHYFTERTLRIDYYHTGTKGSESCALDQLYEEGSWPGSKINLIDTLNLGEYLVRVYDQSTQGLIYSRGFSTMFNEWQTTDEAVGSTRTFHETIRMPFPRRAVQMTVSKRDREMLFHEIFSCAIDPNVSGAVNREKKTARCDVLTLMENGAPSEKVDLLILGDGYRKADLEKFKSDAKHFNDVMFGTSPFKEHAGDFNVRALEVISQDSGIDKPDKNIWKSTALGTRYYTFGSARYVLTEENRALRDIAGSVPYDFILILLNDNRYGGGGIYNLYTTCFANTDNPSMAWQRDYVYVHEFGHSFGGLGDEYYSSQVSYNDFYPKGVEPWEPNLTALLDPDHPKWKTLVRDGTPVPTPWDKTMYDTLERERGKLDRLAPDYYKKREPIYQAEQNILKNAVYKDAVGAFEGAGYAPKGMYRPSVDCRMFSLSLVDFDPVCAAAIARVINFYAH
jgi:hypothetical protein